MLWFITTSGLTLYAIILDPFSDRVWNATAQVWGAPDPANWTDYVVALVEHAGTGWYRATFPTAISNPMPFPFPAPYPIGVYQMLGSGSLPTGAAPTDLSVGFSSGYVGKSPPVQKFFSGAAQTVVAGSGDRQGKINLTGNAGAGS